MGHPHLFSLAGGVLLAAAACSSSGEVPPADMSLLDGGTLSDGSSVSDGSLPTENDASTTETATLESDTRDWNGLPHPLVYMGHADPWHALNDGAAAWKYVQTNADGLYVNFIVADSQWGTTEKIIADLAPTAALMRNKNLFYEADELSGTEANDQRNLDAFKAAGLKTTHATYNYTIEKGWNEQRAATLRTRALSPDQPSRPAVVLLAPWTLGGDVTKDVEKNVEVRRQVTTLADGFSTDGPLGFWVNNQGGFREGSYSLVRYGKSLSKFHGMMIAPYAAGVAEYSGKTQFLTRTIEYVLAVEENAGSPSSWLIWEYVEDVPATPEANPDGTPANSTTGVTYWLLHHLKGEEVKLRKLGAFGSNEGSAAAFVLENTSAWCTMSPALHATIDDADARWEVRFTLDGADITDSVLKDGYAFTGAHRLAPEEKHGFNVTIACTDCASPDLPKKPTVHLSLLGHRDVPKPNQMWTIR